MVLEFYGIRIDPRRVWHALGVTEFGAPPTRLPELARLGLSVQYEFARDEEPILTAMRLGKPPICLVTTGALSYWSQNVQHAVVVVAQDEFGFLVNDPAYADQRRWVSFDAFMLAWSDMDYQYALITPPR